MFLTDLYSQTAIATSGLMRWTRRFLSPQKGSVAPIDSIGEAAAQATIILGVSLAILCGLLTRSHLKEVIAMLYAYDWGPAYLFLGRAMFFANTAAFIWRVALVTRYSPVAECTDDELLKCTVIVPAYNEGRQVLHTLRSILNSDYPAEKLQIIAVDDGSADDTWIWMQMAEKESDGRIKTIRLPKNQGKRTALWAGFMTSTGDVLVTIDSDSIVEPQTLRRLTSPFFYQQNIGGVAGCVRVLNKKQGVIPRMLDVSFAYSFDFIRASQSMVNTVFCTPGALAAYRREPLMKVLDQWKNQTFLGRPATIGEDRAITNLILRQGYHVTFQSDAIVYTNVPVSYQGLCKMFIRWARSNVRETLVMSKFIFSKFRHGPALGARVNFLLSLIGLTMPQFLLVGMLFCIYWQPVVFIIQILMASAIVATIPAVFYAWRRRSAGAVWAFVYGAFWCFGLAWITPWSILTARNGKWLTRDLPGNLQAAPQSSVLQRPAA
jgi:hyaluronan synthase